MNKTSIFSRNFSYGWVVVGVSALLLLGSYGAMLSFGVFLKPLTEDFGWTRAMTSGAMSTVMGVSGLVGIMMGRLTDKYGARLPVAIGTLIGGLAYWLMSQTSSIWQLYLYLGVGQGICVGSCYAPISTAVSRWFVEKRALALGIVLMGITIGQMLLSPLSTHVITTHGWHSAYMMLAGIVWVTAIPAVILLGKKPPQPASSSSAEGKAGKPVLSREWSAREAAKTAPFWMLMITGFVLSAGSYFVSTHIVAYATDIGMSAATAALILTVMGIGGIAGTLLAWSITVKLGNRGAFLLLLAIQALVLFLLIWIKSLWPLFALVLIFGFGFSAAVPVRTAMVPQLFGTRSMGMLMGLASFAWSVGGIIGPVLAGYTFDLSHNYDMAFLVGGLVLIIGMLAIYFLDGRSR
jgi:MFS family permease